jgi:hypothetical protein
LTGTSLAVQLDKNTGVKVVAQVDAFSQALVGELKRELKMKTLTKAVIGISAAGAAYVGVQKIRHAVSDEHEERVQIHGFVSRGYEAVREAFAGNFLRGRELGAACCVYHKGEKVVDL